MDRLNANFEKYGLRAAAWEESRWKYRSRSKRAVENRVEYAKWQLRTLEDNWRKASEAQRIAGAERELLQRIESSRQEAELYYKLAGQGRSWQQRAAFNYTIPARYQAELEKIQADPLGYATREYESKRAELKARRNRHTKELFKLGGKWHERRKQKAVNKKRRLRRKPRRNLRNDVNLHLEYLVHRVKRKSFKTLKHISYAYNKPIRWVKEAKEAAIVKGLITEAEWKASLRGPGRPRKGKPRGPYKKRGVDAA
jgi:hypothetical protein